MVSLSGYFVFAYFSSYGMVKIEWVKKIDYTDLFLLGYLFLIAADKGKLQYLNYDLLNR